MSNICRLLFQTSLAASPNEHKDKNKLLTSWFCLANWIKERFYSKHLPRLLAIMRGRQDKKSGAIIGDGDRKSYNPSAPMIWDNFSIFRTSCAILTSYIRADRRTCRWLSRGCCHVAWSKWWVWRKSLEDFSQRWLGIKQGIRFRALTSSCMPWANGKGEFFQGRKQFHFQFCEWIWSARTVKLNVLAFAFVLIKLWKKTVYSGIELIWEFPNNA